MQTLLSHAPIFRTRFGNYGSYDGIFALDTLHCAGFTLIPLLHQHEDCCQELYYLTFKGSTLVDVKEVASSGGDGDWSKTSTLTLLPNGRLRVISREVDAVEVEEADISLDTAATLAALNKQRYALDSTVTDFELTPQGKLVRLPVDSVRFYNRQL
ncbi:hypothetical protein [Hymenobacter sp. DG01]|uniref:hypothetical protein n=1 Tax=Hymenobacter sp. DG01 TaxID=2584940 RepID=UPI001122B7EF|nr:hypothetical protein [Hymenobacter sp. DG01]